MRSAHRFAAAGFLSASLVVSAAGLKVGQPPPEISLDQLLPDQPVENARLKSLKGKAVVLEFWATWCGPCIAQIPHLNELATRFRERPIVFLSISPDNRSDIDPILKKMPIEGLVGIVKGRKLMEDYGVTGIPRTFLIDAEGNLAADLRPYQLTSAMLEDLIARRPVLVPQTVPFSSTIREEDNSLSPPLLDVMIRPSTAMDFKRATASGKNELLMKSMTLMAVMLRLYTTPPSRIEGDALEDKTRYDVWISLPGAGREFFQALARQIVCSAFHVKVRQEMRDTDVYLLKAPDGKPPGLVEAPLTGMTTTTSGKGKLSTSGSLHTLAMVLESPLGKPVIDETGLQGGYEIKLTYDAGVSGSLEKAVQSLGLALEPARRPVEFLIVNKLQP